MKISSLFQKKKPVLSFEIFPPRTDTPLKDIGRVLDELCETEPDFISVTFGAAGSAINSRTAEIAVLIKEKYHIEPMVHLTCINHDMAEIDSILSELQAADIRNILALRGDKCAERPPANHFAYASDLIRHIKEFGDFSVSGACYPENHPETPDRETSLRHLKEKTDAGTEHLISQLFFGNHDFYTFLKDVRAAGIEVPVSAGIMPVTGKGRIERMAALCCAFLPPEVVAMMHRYEFDKDSLMNAGAEYAAAQIKELIARGADGIHLYTMNNPAVVKKIYKEIR